MKILIIDNYDSFTYNLVQYLREAPGGASVSVLRNDAFEITDLEEYDALVLSPGPGLPAEAGLLLNVIQHYAERKPILGVCLGHQAIAEVFGGSLLQLEKVFHGLASEISQTGKSLLFEGLDSALSVGRYHSWVVDESTLPDCLEVTARDASGQIMALEHREFPIFGLQFHPESILTSSGKSLINNYQSIVSNISKLEA